MSADILLTGMFVIPNARSVTVSQYERVVHWNFIDVITDSPEKYHRPS